jgi:hypothetical protein
MSGGIYRSSNVDQINSRVTARVAKLSAHRHFGLMNVRGVNNALVGQVAWRRRLQ